MDRMSVKRMPHIAASFNASDWGITGERAEDIASELNRRLEDLVNSRQIGGRLILRLLGDVMNEMVKLKLATFNNDVTKVFLGRVMTELYGEEWVLS